MGVTRILKNQTAFIVNINTTNVNPGGWSYGVFTLQGLYNEHLMKRNRWSQTNAGFDLARYYGTHVTFVPHMWWDYIVYIDPEYGTTGEFKQLTHPAIMITHPKSILVLSQRRAPSRTKWPRVWIPRPAIMPDDWYFQRDMAKKGLFAFGWAWIDLDRPWASDLADPDPPFPQNTDGSGDLINQKPQNWWVDKQNTWLTNWGQAVSSNTSTTDKGRLALNGPFVIKTQQNGLNIKLAQNIAFYEVKFEWGGEYLTDRQVVDPATLPPLQGARVEAADQRYEAREPEPSPSVFSTLSGGLQDRLSGFPVASPPGDPHHWSIKPEDLDDAGQLTDAAFSRLTGSPSSSGRSTGSFSSFISDPGPRPTPKVPVELPRYRSDTLAEALRRRRIRSPDRLGDRDLERPQKKTKTQTHVSPRPPRERPLSRGDLARALRDFLGL